MSTIIDALNASRSAGTAAAAAPTAANASSIQDRFLTLLVTQMKNQDPLNPLDNAQVTTQLAQISTVSGIDKLNDTIAGLSARFSASQALDNASMIGRSVLSPGSAITLAQGTGAGAVELSEPADKVTVTITGPAGEIVRRLDLGAREAGLVSFTWNGADDSGRAMRDGAYGMRVEATRGTKAVEATTLTSGTVSGLNLVGGASNLSINGVGDVDLSAVRRIQ